MERLDVVVIGAGPAGCSAAITLARGGRHVALIDKATFPRDKVCGDGLTSLALAELEALGLEPHLVDSWQWAGRCVVRSPSGYEVPFELPEGPGRFAAVATRSDLDAALVELAAKEGVELCTGDAVVAAREDDDGVELHLGGGRHLRARWAVGADGMWSPLRKLIGLHDGAYLGEWHAVRHYATGVSGRGAEELFVSFEADLLPGYFWSFPLPGGRANVGFGIERGGKAAVRDTARLWAELLDRAHVRDVLGPEVAFEARPPRAWPIPARVHRAVAVGRRTLFVGDAVGACDVMTGEGIGQALLTGRMAAEAICAETGDPTGSYASALRRELLADHRMSALLVRALRHRKGARAAVRVAGANDWTRRNFARWLFEDYPRGVITTPRRWRPGLLSGPGSYR